MFIFSVTGVFEIFPYWSGIKMTWREFSPLGWNQWFLLPEWVPVGRNGWSPGQTSSLTSMIPLSSFNKNPLLGVNACSLTKRTGHCCSLFLSIETSDQWSLFHLTCFSIRNGWTLGTMNSSRCSFNFAKVLNLMWVSQPPGGGGGGNNEKGDLKPHLCSHWWEQRRSLFFVAFIRVALIQASARSLCGKMI